MKRTEFRIVHHIRKPEHTYNLVNTYFLINKLEQDMSEFFMMLSGYLADDEYQCTYGTSIKDKDDKQEFIEGWTFTRI